MSYDELIAEAQTIVIVRLKARGPLPDHNEITKYTLQTVELIKGKAESTYEFFSFGAPISDNDFNGHAAREFWTKDIGRSKFPGGLCGPDHSFREGRVYLYFPDLQGAMKSAEAIRDSNDEWLLYVRTKVGEAANRALQPTK